MAGKGPNSTVNFETHSEEMGTETVFSEWEMIMQSWNLYLLVFEVNTMMCENIPVNSKCVLPFHSGLSWQDQTILGVCVVALLCTIICSVAVRRWDYHGWTDWPPRYAIVLYCTKPVALLVEHRAKKGHGFRSTVKKIWLYLFTYFN